MRCRRRPSGACRLLEASILAVVRGFAGWSSPWRSASAPQLLLNAAWKIGAGGFGPRASVKERLPAGPGFDGVGARRGSRALHPGPALDHNLAEGILRRVHNWFVFNLVDGLIRVTFFLAYILLITRLKDIRRVFQYHGAEHKVVYTWEAGEELTVENARAKSTLHPRCEPVSCCS